ncbi:MULTISPECIES: replicative DNA helicase [Idiomarina]|jgi:replicative DNA helicase|uniref:Replicative DNA helicase n=4 Tax=Idiomarina baltica TaxID=190892 RepID=A0ABM9WIT3_9GAMM|nr:MULTISPECIES: replicative DNA helicase [Idiomarina]MAF76103.1 replicative DNA helicase [Idiomarinaceae bacterium]MEC8926198.1 replicative DNA helicase [Pseudomonadota bacterium]EAQ30799.1 Replicative DNA helicase [Idiomarina baltica OS145]KXS34032.1 MAG: replicative DNA helicase [Idiomarina sp. T82-3]HAE89828.1 replicative DNA helicase [Idiomarina sp.]
MAEKNKQRDKSIEALRSAPHSIEAEQSVLGGLMLDNDAWDKVSGLIIAQDFYHRAHRLIFTAMQSLADSSQPMDLVTVSEELEANTELDAVGGFAYLGEISKNTPSAANIVAYANIVRERAVLREMIAAANDIAESGYDTQGRTSQQLLDEAESKVFRIAEKRTSATEGPKGVSDILAKTIEKIETLSNIKNHNGVTGTSTGFHDLDQMTAGLQPSDLIIVAARPSMGKTTFAMNLAENVAMNEEKPVLVFSLEMPSEQIMMRMLASLSRVDQNRVRTGRLEDDDWARIASVMNILNDKNNLYIDDSSGLTPTEVRSRARRVARDHGGLSMIMVDYLQLMTVPGMSENRTLEIAEISRSLKSLAKELSVPVVALSQLNRSLEQRSDKRPVNSDLRESGSIEQDADVIMFIYRDEVYHPDSAEKGLAEIIIGKQRNGPIGKVELKFHGHLSRFDNFARASDDERY